MDNYHITITVCIKDDNSVWDAPEGEAQLKWELPVTQTSVLTRTLEINASTLMQAAINDLEGKKTMELDKQLHAMTEKRNAKEGGDDSDG